MPRWPSARRAARRRCSYAVAREQPSAPFTSLAITKMVIGTTRGSATAVPLGGPSSCAFPFAAPDQRARCGVRDAPDENDTTSCGALVVVAAISSARANSSWMSGARSEGATLNALARAARRHRAEPVSISAASVERGAAGEVSTRLARVGGPPGVTTGDRRWPAALRACAGCDGKGFIGRCSFTGRLRERPRRLSPPRRRVYQATITCSSAYSSRAPEALAPEEPGEPTVLDFGNVERTARPREGGPTRPR